MDISQLADLMRSHRKDTDALLKQLAAVCRLDRDRSANLVQVRTAVTKVGELLSRLERGSEAYEALHSWLDQYQRELDAAEEALRKQFGMQLDQTLGQQGLALSGQYPEFRAGLFTIEVDSSASKAVIWYGPKQERLGQCPSSARDVGSLIEKLRRELGSHLDSKEILARTYDAYSRVVGSRIGEPAPITQVLVQFAYLSQDARFLQDPKRDYYKSCSRADFSHDLYRLRREGTLEVSGRKLHLAVATREHTKHRRDFLWIPDDETGEGTTYSHLRFKEVTP